MRVSASSRAKPPLGSGSRRRYRQNIKLVVEDEARLAAGEREDETLVEARLHVLVGLGAEAGVRVHRHRVELPHVRSETAQISLRGVGHTSGQLRTLKGGHRIGQRARS